MQTYSTPEYWRCAICSTADNFKRQCLINVQLKFFNLWTGINPFTFPKLWATQVSSSFCLILHTTHCLQIEFNNVFMLIRC